MRSRALPKYRQIAEGLRAEIAAGRYAPGDRLPSVVELIAASGASLGTVLKAIATLEAEGLVRSVRGQGIFVSAAGESAAGMRARIAELEGQVRRLLERLAECERGH
jgi:DNA-binding GntR family transcriptional regulator